MWRRRQRWFIPTNKPVIVPHGHSVYRATLGISARTESLRFPVRLVALTFFSFFVFPRPWPGKTPGFPLPPPPPLSRPFLAPPPPPPPLLYSTCPPPPTWPTLTKKPPATP